MAKKILLILFLVISSVVFSQSKKQQVLTMASSASTFTVNIPAGALVVDETLNVLYRVTVFTASGTTLAAATKVLVGSADGNGIYTGSGSLSAVTNVSQTTHTLNFLMGASSGKITFGQVGNHGALFIHDNTGAEKIRLDSGGSNCFFIPPVGVNMSGGTARLSVKALGTGTDQVQRWRNSADSDNLMIVQGNGNVGIGESTISARLHVKGSGSTSATTSLLVENSLVVNSLTVLDEHEQINPGFLLTSLVEYHSD